MIAPFPLYVDEISADKTKATVSKQNSVSYNLKTMSLATAVSFDWRNNISIMPIGRFVCIVVTTNGSKGMILLDLVGKEELAMKMAEKFDHTDLQNKFMQVYTDVISHPEYHRRFKLVVGRPE